MLSVEEIEAIRLKDREGLEQEECAGRMQVSRPTFQRILAGARSKLAEAIIEGKAIKVEGGNYRIAAGQFVCSRCRGSIETACQRGRRRSMVCPQCEPTAPDSC